MTKTNIIVRTEESEKEFIRKIASMLELNSSEYIRLKLFGKSRIFEHYIDYFIDELVDCSEDVFKIKDVISELWPHLTRGERLELDERIYEASEEYEIDIEYIDDTKKGYSKFSRR